ncbi:hypothetical protein [Candidatus Nesciobacter abundans]|uniref:RimM N-terminal domain-containing protein n=1 Tax=Candidatus Nesciobacter abundans TaxID=2601668 RepID=A0A5C0UFM0_9PROT|nr:hypothetical protein [Candidatus Nesciobacter abundans]QEK38896.1 hypothetical protein FZC36_00375 [Candidatus Nesciobacter abundans]
MIGKILKLHGFKGSFKAILYQTPLGKLFIENSDIEVLEYSLMKKTGSGCFMYVLRTNSSDLDELKGLLGFSILSKDESELISDKQNSAKSDLNSKDLDLNPDNNNSDNICLNDNIDLNKSSENVHVYLLGMMGKDSCKMEICDSAGNFICFSKQVLNFGSGPVLDTEKDFMISYVHINGFCKDSGKVYIADNIAMSMK